MGTWLLINVKESLLLKYKSDISRPSPMCIVGWYYGFLGHDFYMVSINMM